MKSLTVSLQHQEQDIAVGKLTFAQGQSYLKLDQSFVDAGLNLSPVKIKLNNDVQIAPRHPFNGLFGIFADSLPDGWGLLLMDRMLAQKGINFSSIGSVERLAYMGNRAMGALSYHPDTGEQHQTNQLISLNQLAQDAQQIYQGSVKEVSQQLHLTGGSPGGARPKAIIGISKIDDSNDNQRMIDGQKAIAGYGDLPANFQHWLVKFPTEDKSKYEGVIEHIYAQMAQSAGINFGPTILIETQNNGGFFATKRFDRQTAKDGTHHNKKVHMHTLAGLVHADFRLPDCDYQTLIKATSFVTHSHHDCVEAFRRMIFNILCGNKDDHTKNFSYLMDDDSEWRLSPAYDITFNQGINGHHSMSVSGFGQDIPRQAIDKVAALIDLKPQQINQIIEQCKDALNQWPALIKTYGVSMDESKPISEFITNQLKHY